MRYADSNANLSVCKLKNLDKRQRCKTAGLKKYQITFSMKRTKTLGSRLVFSLAATSGRLTNQVRAYEGCAAVE